MALPQVNSSRYSTKLPSTGIEVDYRPYLVKEEKIMMVALESKDNKQIVKAMKDVAEACIYDDVDMESFTVFDLEWIFLQLRSKSVGENANVNLKCLEEDCNAMTEVSIKLDEVEMDDYDPNRVVQMNDNVGIQMRYPSVSLMEQYDEEKLQSVEGAFDLIIDCLEIIYDRDNVYHVKDEKREEVKEFVEALTSTQFKILADWLKKIPTVRKDIEWGCSKCEANNKLELRGLQSFFT
tara:strand:- start:2932 stop:3642 length:711 start_codon:yes stop_codon:yes gene_type:complete